MNIEDAKQGSERAWKLLVMQQKIWLEDFRNAPNPFIGWAQWKKNRAIRQKAYEALEEAATLFKKLEAEKKRRPKLNLRPKVE